MAKPNTAGSKKNTAQKGTLKKVLKYVQRHGFFMVLSILFAAITVALTLYTPILIGDAIDLIVGKGQVDFAGIAAILIKTGIIIGITALIQWLMNTINNRITYHVVRDIRNEAFRKIEILPLSYIDAHPYGDIVNRVIADADQFADGLLMGFTQLFTGIVTILGTLFFLFSISYSRCDRYSAVSVHRAVHCKPNLPHVPGSVRDPRSADCIHRRNDRKSEGRSGVLPRG